MVQIPPAGDGVLLLLAARLIGIYDAGRGGPVVASHPPTLLETQ